MDREPFSVQMQSAKPSRTSPQPFLLVPRGTLQNPLPDHLVGLIALAQAEGGGEVAREHVHLLDVRQHSLVDRLLIRSSAAVNLLLLRLLSLLEERLLTGLLLGLLRREVLWLRNLRDLLLVDALQVHLLGCRNDVSSIDSPERDAVDLEGAGNEENALVESLQEDDTLASEAAGEEDQNGTRLQRLSGSPWALDLADLLLLGHILSRVPLLGLLRVMGDRPGPRAELLGRMFCLCRHRD